MEFTSRVVNPPHSIPTRVTVSSSKTHDPESRTSRKDDNSVDKVTGFVDASAEPVSGNQ